MDDTDLFDTPMRRPTGNRPLLGQTILVVEDSLYACEALRLMCLRGGARIRRADCLKSARRHLQLYRPTVMVVDVGLPDGSGTDLIVEAVTATPRVPVVLGTSGDRFAQDAAMEAGADGFLAKPLTSFALFQGAILSCLPPDLRPVGPFPVNDDVIRPDPVAFRDDMAHVADVLTDSVDDRVLDYIAQFLTGVARSVSDDDLEAAARQLASDRAAGRPVGADTALIAGLVQDRMHQVRAI